MKKILVELMTLVLALGILVLGIKVAGPSDQIGMVGATGPITALSMITSVVIAFGPINL